MAANKKTIGDEASSYSNPALDNFNTSSTWFLNNHVAAWHWRAIRLDHAISGDYTGHGTTLALSDDGLYGAHIGVFATNYLPQLSYNYVNNIDQTIGSLLLNSNGDPEGYHGALVANLAVGAPVASADYPDDLKFQVQAVTGPDDVWYIDPYEGGVASDGQFFAISGLSQSLALWTEGYTPPEVDVVNMSWGDTNTFGAGDKGDGTLGQTHSVDPLFQFAADAGRDGKGTILVNSAGNNRNTTIELNGESGVGGPSNSRLAIVVGAVENNHTMADQLTSTSGNWGLDRDYTDYRFAYWSPNSGSSYGANLLVSTPGDELATFIASTDNTVEKGSTSFNKNEQITNGIYYGGTGTSAAAPIVSGAVMLMLEANPNLGWRDVQDILADSSWMIDKNTANPTGVSDFDATDHPWENSGSKNQTKNGELYQFNRDYGYGMLDAGGAVRLAEYWDLLRDPRDSHNETVLAVTIDPNGGTGSFSITQDIEIDHVSLYLEQFDVKSTNSSLVLTHNADLDSKVATTLFDGLIYSTAATQTTGNYTNIDWDFLSQQFRGDTSEGTWEVSLTGGNLGERAILKIYGDVSKDDIFVVTNDYNNGWSAGLDGGDGTDSLNFSALSDGVDYILGTDMKSSNAKLVHTYSPVRVNLGAQHTVDSTAASALSISSKTTLNPTQANFMLSDVAKSFATISGIENIVGSWGNDVLAGDENPNLLIGSAGNDYLFGAGGDDQLIGGMYNRTSQQNDTDYLNGGAGFDTLDLSHLTRLVTVDRTFVSASGTTKTVDNFEYVKNLKNTIEEATTTATIDVSITLNNATWAQASMVEATRVDTRRVTLSYSGSKEASGSITNPTPPALSTALWVKNVENIYFGDGDDTFIGDTSANLVRPGLGAGTFDGRSQGTGEDTFDLSTFSTDLVIQDATNNTAKEAAIPAGGVPTSNLGKNASTANINATFSNFERLLLGAGNDLIELNSSEISNVDGGAGYDLLFFTDSTGITLDLSDTGGQTLDSTTFTLNSIEGVQGTAQADTITGNDADNLFLYSGGADEYYGGAGDDALVLYGTSASVSVTLWDTNAEGVATAVVGSTNVQLHGIESLYGGSGNDVFYGDAKSNTFRPGGGANTFHGGSGHDTIDLQDQATGVNFDFSAATPVSGFINVPLGGNSVKLRSVEAIIGTTANDVLTTGNGIDTIYTGWGADTVTSSNTAGALIADGVLGNLAITSISAIHTLTEADMNQIYGEQRHALVGKELKRNQSGTITSTVFEDIDLGLSDHAMVEITLDELSYISMLEFTESFYAIGMVDEQGIETVSLRQTPKGEDQSNWYFELTDTAVQSLRIYGDTDAVDSIDQRSFRILGYTDDTRDAPDDNYDDFVGGFGNDTMIFSDGTNYARGNYGNDILVGGAGIDYLVGDGTKNNAGTNNDLLIGGSSPIRSSATIVEGKTLFGDRLEGGYGNDTYVVAWNQGITTISDIEGEDTVILTETDSRTLRLENIYININNFRDSNGNNATSKSNFAKFDLEMYFVTANSDAYLDTGSGDNVMSTLRDLPKIIFEDFAEKDGNKWVSNYEHIKHIGDMSRDFAFVDNIISAYSNNSEFNVANGNYDADVTVFQSYLMFIDPY